MAEKNFTDGAIERLMDSTKDTNFKTTGRPRIHTDIKEKSSEDGLYKEYTRATFIVRKDLLQKLKGYAFLEDQPLKEVVNTMLAEWLADKRDVREELEGGGKDDRA